MGSLLGNYVHLTWAGYENTGTYRNQSNWTKRKDHHKDIGAQQRNFDPIIFHKHKQAILNDALVLQQKDIKLLETEYNKLITQEYNALKELSLNNRSKYNSIIQTIISGINKKWSAPAIQAEISAGLQFDKDRQTWIYKPTKQFQKMNRSDKGSKIPQLVFDEKYHWRDSKNNIHYEQITNRQIRPLMDYCQKLHDYLNINYGNSAAADMKQLLILKYNLSKQVDILSTKMIQKVKSTSLTGPLNTIGLISDKLAKEYKSKIDEIRFKYVDAESITEDIQQAMAEVLGNIAGKNITTLGKKHAEAELVKALSVGKTMTTRVANAAGTRSLVGAQVHAEYKKGQESKETQIIQRKKEVLKNVKGKEFVSYEYDFTDIGDERQGKTDVSIVLQGQQFGISMKNTDLSKEYTQRLQGQTIEMSAITLQNSSLMLYLLGAQTKFGRDIGNHYLNILAQHSDAKGNAYDKMRKSGINSLSLYILYSALTGQGQLREGQFANILAIYDKAQQKEGVPQIKLFDMYDIIKRADAESQKFSNSQSANFLYPALHTVYLNNTKAPEGSGARISNLLIEARRKNIRASLSHQFLNSILRNR